MPQRSDWLQRIKGVERELHATRIAADRLLVDAASNPTMLPPELRLRDVRMAAERLEGTYLIRLFAEFETGLRLFWPTARHKTPPNRTHDLVNGIAAMRKIPHDILNAVHRVREYRNTLVHERTEPAPAVSMAEARKGLCVFFSSLPPHW